MIVLAIISVPGAVLQAQTTDPILTTAKEVLQLPGAAAEAGTTAVKLRGVVVYVTAKGDEFSLHDGQACVSVMVSGDPAAPALGAEVEIEGTVFSEPFFERQRPRIKLTKLSASGIKALPEAPPVSVQEAAEFKHLDQWISVEGTVMQVRSSMSLFTIQLVSKAASCNVLVRDWPRDGIPRNWIGGRVRVSGINRAYLPGSNFFAMVAPSPTQVVVQSTGVVDPLDAPVTTVTELRKTGPSKDRHRLKGTLLGATAGNVYYTRGEDGKAFSFYMLHPIDEDKSGRYSTPIVQPQLKPGDQVEVVGLPGKTDPGVHLDFAVVRVLKPGPEPMPKPASIESIVAGNHVHDLVEVQGRLLSIDDVLVAPGRFRTTMKLADGENKIVAFLDATSRGMVKGIEVDHLLRVSGIVTGPPHFPEIRLWVRSTDDLLSQGVAQEVETRRLWTSLGIALAIVIMLTGWVLMLRRSRAAVREVNASLEARVAERTAELAAAKDDVTRALSQERELNELKTRFVSIVSHEFRTPLGVTMSAVELLRHFGHQLTPEKHEELYNDIYSATVQMSGLMEQVLMLGRTESGKLHWKPVPVDLPDLCGKLAEESVTASHRRCPVNFVAEGDLSGAQMDSSLIRHIVSNLLSNAVKYSPKDSPVEFIVRREGDEVEMIVRDQGIGIPEADQPKLFEAFHRASNVGETQGTGLGLLLVKRCVELHQGRIEVQSKAGEGSVFTVRLPFGKE